MRQTFAIFWDVFNNKSLQLWFLFNMFLKASGSIADNVAQVYLTNDLGFPSENLAIIKVVCTPFNILLAFLGGGLATEQPFLIQSYNLLAIILISNYTILYLLATFPSHNEQSDYTYFHVFGVIVINDLIRNFEFVTAFAILMKRTDKRVSGIHVTLLASIYNFAEFVHKFYIFALIDSFGIYVP